MVTQRYRVERFRHDGRFLDSGFMFASSLRIAEDKAERTMHCPTFNNRVSGGPYIHVSLYPEIDATGTCSRCGEPRYRCGGESDPHE